MNHNLPKYRVEKVVNYIIGIIVSILIVICIIGYNYSVKNYAKIINESNNDINYEEYEEIIDSSDKIFKKEEYPRVLSTPLTIKLAQMFTSNFTKEDENDVVVDTQKRNIAYDKLIKGETDVIILIEPSEEELDKAKEMKVELVSYKIANEGLMFAVNKENEVNNITTKQIQKIYTGKEKNWDFIGEKDEKIIPYQRLSASEVQLGMLSTVMNGLKINDKIKGANISDTSTLINNISDNTGAIGYLYYNNYIQCHNNIKILSVNGVFPTYETINNETYPIKIGYYAIIRKEDEKKENVQKLINAMLSRKGKKIVENSGYVPSK